MKDRFCSFGGLGNFISSRKTHNIRVALCASLLGLLSTLAAWGQSPPGLQWANNLGATLFATDTSGNVYAYTNGAVEILNSSGVLVQSNTICPIPGQALRDAAGNYYFAGSFAGTQDFGGITLVGGFIFGTNAPNTNFPTCYLAKYDSGAHLQWVVPFGIYSFPNRVDDMALNSDGTITIAFDDGASLYTGPYLCLFGNGGTNLLQTNLVNSVVITAGIKLTGIAGTKGCYLLYSGDQTIHGGFYNASGPQGIFTQLQTPPITEWKSWLSSGFGRPVPGTNNDAYFAWASGVSPSSQSYLQDNQAGPVVLSSQSLGYVEQWVVAGDGQGRLYLADANQNFSEYLGNGTLVWSTNYGSWVMAMLLDSQGNRYISMVNGTIAKLQPDTVAAPVITNAPVGGTIFAGSSFTFTVGASGYAPLGYQWLYQSNSMASPSPISNATNASLSLTDATAAQSGLYSVVVSNVSGSVTSTPVALSVKLVEFYAGSQMLRGGWLFLFPPTLTIQSAFPGGDIFYTLDGSTPSFLSTPYTGAFVLSNSATLNAIGYSADFSQSALADTVFANVPPQYTLSVSTAGGGSITLNPPGGSYTNTTISYPNKTAVSVTAVPATGYSFLNWQGASSSTSPTITVTMNQNETLSAVFGTTLSTTVSGNGQLMLAPPGGVYPYGSVVRLEALPAPGYFFGVWGNAANWGGSTNPLYFPVTNATPTVSSLFAAVPANEAALTVLILGKGKVSVSPSGNVFATNQSVTLTATPDAGQSFIDWSGSVSSTQNPLTVAMTQSRVVVASFSGQSVALSPMSPPPGLTPAGFKFTLMGDPQSVYQIQCLTNITHTNWQNLGTVTNFTGQMQFTDPAATNLHSAFYRAVLVPQ